MLLLPHFFTLCTAKPLKRVGAPCYLHFLTPLSYSTELLPPQFHWNRSMSPMPCASQSQCSVLSSSYWLLTTPDTFNHSHLETLSSLNFQGTIAYTFSCWPLLPLLLQPYGDVGLPKALSPSVLSIFSVLWLQKLSIWWWLPNSDLHPGNLYLEPQFLV